MEFVLSEQDADVLRHLASVEPEVARRYLQERPELARRMTSWPPEIRLEVCRIVFRSVPAEKRNALIARHPGSSLLDQLAND